MRRASVRSVTEGGDVRLATCTVVLALLASLAGALGAAARGTDPSALDGRWRIAHKATTAQLVAHGMPPAVAEALGHLDVEIPAVDLGASHARWFDLATGKTTCRGTYVVRGDRVGFSFSRCPVATPAGVTWMRWSIFRDRVTFTALPGRANIVAVTISPWVRVR
jgi:hypothetical protein